LDVAIAYHLGAMYHGWVNTNYPDQVYTYRPSNLDPINFPSSSNDPNNPNIDPKTGVAVFVGTIWTLDALKSFDDFLKTSKEKMKVPIDNTKVVLPPVPILGPKK
jgi:hypothetical protein